MRPDSHTDLVSYICDDSLPARHIILIDPDAQTPEIAAKRCIAAVSAGSRMIFVGGSTGTDDDNVHQTIIAIQEALELCSWNASQNPDRLDDQWKVPVILFPAGAHALSPAADGITFMMLMNSQDRKFLIGEQVSGAPAIKKSGVTPLSMGYIVCEPGGKVGEVGKADLLKADQTELSASYSTCAELFGFPLLYLEAGSGASQPVHPDLISAARDSSDSLTIIVGGGIRDGKSANAAITAGADWIVTGNLTEQYDDPDKLQQVLTDLIEEMN